MTDYTAHDIHLIDQGAVDALRAVDALAADPETARRLAERGEAVYGAELTADLHNTVGGRAMSLAGWAAFATIRLVQAQARHSTDHDEAARMWAEDVDMVWAKVAERDAELEKVRAERDQLAAYNRAVKGANDDLRAELADVRNQAHRDHTEHQQVLRDKNALANENARLRSQLADLDKTPCNCCFVDGSTQRCGRTATTAADVPPFGYLDVADTCRDRINGTATNTEAVAS